MTVTSPLRWSILSPLTGGALHAVGSGVFYTLLPLRLVAEGNSIDTVGLVFMAEGAGFLAGCLGSVRLIRSVGEVRAYAALSACSAVLVLSLGASPEIVVIMVIQALLGFSNAGQAVVIESWLNAMVPNAGRGRVLTLYVLVLGLFAGLGQLLALGIDPGGSALLMTTAAFYALALVPVTAVWVDGPDYHEPVRMHVLRSFMTSPIGALACLLTGLVSSAFSAVGPLYGQGLGFSKDKIVLLMAAATLGALFLQFPLGYLSDRVDRRAMLTWLAIALTALCALFLLVDGQTPFWLILVLFSIFGGLTEIFYPLGVAHANDRATSSEFVTLSSNLLLIWGLGGAIGPAVAAAGLERMGPDSFFWYVIALTAPFGAFAAWRLLHQPKVPVREEFVTYPHASPAVYQWVPHKDDAAGDGNTFPDKEDDR